MNWQTVFQLLAAALFGSVIGLEREFKRKEAGLQTHSLVCLGSCLFVIISSQSFGGFLVSSVATGIGFIGAGVIIYKKDHVEGITTAAALWCSGGIGVAVGVGNYILALTSLILVTVILIGYGAIEKCFFKNRK